MKGFFILILFICFLLGGAYFVYTKSAKTSSEFTQSTLDSIYKYPGSTSWEKVHITHCIKEIQTCEPSSRIQFETKDPWTDIYSFYKENLVAAGWNTKNIVVTSIPTSIVFTNESGCTLTLLQDESPIPLLNSKIGAYKFSLYCPV